MVLERRSVSYRIGLDDGCGDKRHNLHGKY